MIDVLDIPGAWYGNSPGIMPNKLDGNVIIDPTKAVEAITWLKKKRAIITSTWVTCETRGFGIMFRQGGQ
jgi:hypothetical protein